MVFQYPPQDRKMNRTLTQKYDMHALRALQKLEAELLQWLAELYGCEEDGVPVEVDLLEVYNLDPPLRAEALVRQTKYLSLFLYIIFFFLHF